MTFSSLELTETLRRPDPPVTVYCDTETGCGREFVGRSRTEVERIFDEHLGELRDPSGHTMEPF